MNFVDVELGHLEEDVASASFHKGGLEAVFLDEAFEVFAIGDFAKVDSAEVFQHGLDVLHDSVHEVPVLVQSEQKVDLSVLIELSYIEISILLAISKAFA